MKQEEKIAVEATTEGATPFAKAYAAKPALLSYAPDGSDFGRNPPYVARFRDGTKRLSYLGASHFDITTNRLIEQEFNSLAPEAIVLELPALAGQSPSVVAAAIKQIPPGYEAYVGGMLALKREIPIINGEPPRSQIVEHLLEHFTAQDILGFYMLLGIPGWRNSGGTEWTEQQYNGRVEDMARMFGLEPASLSTKRAFKEWYASRNRKPFDFESFMAGETAPIPGAQSLFTNRVGHQMDLVRDRHIIRVIARVMSRFDRVLVVYGAGHFHAQSNALEAMMGEITEYASLDEEEGR